MLFGTSGPLPVPVDSSHREQCEPYCHQDSALSHATNEGETVSGSCY